MVMFHGALWGVGYAGMYVHTVIVISFICVLFLIIFVSPTLCS